VFSAVQHSEVAVEIQPLQDKALQNIAHPGKEVCSTQSALLHRITNRIRQSLDLQDILSATVAEVRSFLGSDRVKVYQFQPDASGMVIAEAIAENRLPSLLGLHFPADDIPPYARELFVRARQRTIVDLMTQQIGISLLDSPDTGQALNPADIRYRAVDPCHAEYLMAMGVQSSVVVPIILGNSLENPFAGKLPSLRQPSQLWGLLVSHHAEPRSLPETDLQFLQAVVDQVSVAIEHSVLLDRMRQQAQQQTSINRITTLLYITPTVQLQAALEETVSIFQGIGGRLYLTAVAHERDRLYTCGEQPQPLEQNRPIEENLLWQKYLYLGTASCSIEEDSVGKGSQPWSVEWMRAVYALTAPDAPENSTQENSTQWAIGDLYREPLFRVLAPSFQDTPIRSLLILPLHQGQQIVGCLTIFRQAIDTEILWAGCRDTDRRQLMPRQSFEVWREQRSQAVSWTAADRKLAEAISERFAMAVTQDCLYQQVQALNQTLEQQVCDRTAELQISNAELRQSAINLQTLVEQQQTLARIVAKVRQSLDLDEILRATVLEVRSVLNADRAVIFRLYPDSAEGSEVIAEDVLPGVLSIIHTHITDDCVNTKHLAKYQDGTVHAIDNLFTAGLKDCYVEMLAALKVKSVLSIPLAIEDDKLWGFLSIHQCTEPRQWQASEIKFAGQIADQLGVAIQHGLLLSQLRQQTQQLTETLDTLKRTQTHLIHSERMSGVGQLVAGVMHEINNPINFIYGNLDPIKAYTQTLLNLLQCYRQEHPQVSSDLQQTIDQADLEFIAADLPNLLESLNEGAKRIRDIVVSLRNFSRLDQTGTKLANLHEGIEQTLFILQHRLKSSHHETSETGEAIENTESDIEVICNYGDLPLIECIPAEINQVFMSIIVNAIDALQNFHPAPGDSSAKTLTITTQKLDANWVQVSIKNSGNHIPDTIKNQLFDPFFTTKPIGKGTGLGLSISYQVIENHQGKLRCVSEINQGAEFIIELPIT
jgi:light-regulated signal transduction histidine kinase (bacteriophytochrome)